MAWRLLGLTAVALALRLAGLDRKSVWFDEAVTWVDAHVAWGTFIESISNDVHPPLGYVVFHLWPFIDSGEFWFRLPAAVLGSLAVPVVYVWARRVKAPAALTAALVAVAPLQIDLAQEARMYGLLLLLTALALLTLERLQSCPGLSTAATFAVAAAALLYTHYYGGFIVLALGVAGLATSARAWVVASLAAAALAFAPWLPVLATQVHNISGDYWIAPPSATALWVTFRDLMAHTPPDEPFRLVLRIAYVVEAGLIAFGAVLAARGRQWAPLALATVPIVVALAISLTVAPVYAVRYISPIGIGVAFLLATGVSRLPTPAGIGLGAVAAVPIVLSLPALYTDPGYSRADLRGAARAIQAQRAPDDVVLHLGAFTATPFDFYYVPNGVTLETNDRAELCRALEGHPRGWLVTAYTPNDEEAQAQAEAGLNTPSYAGDLIKTQQRFLGITVFSLTHC